MKMIRGGILLLAAMAATAVFGASDLVEGVIDRSGSGDVVVGNWAPQAYAVVNSAPASGGDEVRAFTTRALVLI